MKVRCKLIYFSLFLNFISFPAVCQPILDSNCIASLGDSINYLNVDNNYSVFPGATGVGITWDFSSLTFSLSFPQEYVMPSSTASYSSFTSSNMAAFRNIFDIEYYYKNSDSLVYYGRYAMPDAKPYSDPLTLLKFPMTYMDSFTDNFAGNFVQNGNSVSRTGTIMATADAYGTLILPAVTVSNVLRIKTVQTTVDVVNSNIITYIDTIYYWYSPVIKDYIAKYYVTEFQSNLLQFAYTMHPADILELNDKDVMVPKIFPNPANEFIWFDFSGSEEPLYHINIINSIGQLIRTINCSSHKFNVDISDMEKGVYLIKLTSDNGGSYSKKIIVN